VKAGLKFRPPATTTADTLAWFKSQPQERRDKLRAGPKPEREAELLKLWAQAQSGQGAPAPARPAVEGKTP
jgi:2'-hydroxyisoflavone reductase